MGICTITHVGTATLLLEMGSLRLLTDPVLDPAGKKYRFALGTSSRKTQDPAVDPESLGELDVVLLSHDHHGDNLDDTGRALLPRVRRVLTTRPGAQRLGGNAIGLAPWDTETFNLPSGGTVRVTATPARHGPSITVPIAGQVIGFVLEWSDQNHGAIYITGDTVFFGGVRQVAERYDIGTVVVHLGAVSFGITGPLRYTMNSAEAIRCIELIDPRTVIPIHYEGWTHFHEPRASVEQAFERAGLTIKIQWLPYGEATPIEV